MIFKTLKQTRRDGTLERRYGVVPAGLYRKRNTITSCIFFTNSRYFKIEFYQFNILSNHKNRTK